MQVAVSVCGCVCLSVGVCAVYVSVCLWACSVTVCLSVCLPVRLSACLSACLPVGVQCDRLPLCLPACLSACLPVGVQCDRVPVCLWACSVTICLSVCRACSVTVCLSVCRSCRLTMAWDLEYDMSELLEHYHVTHNNRTGGSSNLLDKVVDILKNSSAGGSAWDGSGRGPGTHGKTLENTLLIFAYSVLSVTAIFGNSLVVYVILKNKRLHTPTNFFLANLAVSDLLVTCLNVPFNIMRHVMYDWPFGETLCHLVNFSLMVSVYVSTYTLTSIALDRHRVVLKPLSARMSKSLAAGLLVSIWVLAVLLSLPFGIYTTVEDFPLILKQDGVPVISVARRCRTDYPAPSSRFEQYLTVATIVLQYVLPLALIGVAYGRIVQSLWSRTHVGAVTANQQRWQARAKRKSIKLLIAVVVVFAMCWLPLNLYHLLTDLHPNPEVFQYNSKVGGLCWFS